MDCRILQKKKCKILQNYTNAHQAIDIAGENNELDYAIIHSDGLITFYQDGYGNMKGSLGNVSYGNCVKIDHQNGYHTLYAHMRNGLLVSPNQYVKKGQVIGYISDSGNAYGKHLHFEVWKDNQRINPLEFINKDFPNTNQEQIEPPTQETQKLKYKIGDTVEISGVYISSTSKEKLRPLITRGRITKIIEKANNPYLLENGRIGWVNNDTIISKTPENRYLSNKTYQGISIVDALKQINVDSSFTNRSNLANLNQINNYQGTTEQNIQMLNLLKQGLLKY